MWRMVRSSHWMRPTQCGAMQRHARPPYHALVRSARFAMTRSISQDDVLLAHGVPDWSSKLRIVVLGYIVRGPIGGMAWHHLQYVLGLKLLGHEVLFIEDSDDFPSCYDPSTHQVGTDATYRLAFARQAFEKLGLNDQWAYFDAHTSNWFGPAARRAVQFAGEADVVINVSGVNPLRHGVAEVPVRVYIDTDPVFTQVRHLTDDR